MPQCSSGNGNEWVVLASSMAIAIAEKQSTENLNTLANFFNALGDNLSIIAAQRENCSNASK